VLVPGRDQLAENARIGYGRDLCRRTLIRSMIFAHTAIDKFRCVKPYVIESLSLPKRVFHGNMSDIKYVYMTIMKEQLVSTPVVKVQEKGQVTIPLEIREKWGLKKGDLVTFVETEQGVIIKPAEIVATEALDKIGRALREKGLSLDELIERGRMIREDLIDEEYGISDSQNP
jgi:AbrB family looped-hinge helix DNA binding protein